VASALFADAEAGRVQVSFSPSLLHEGPGQVDPLLAITVQDEVPQLRVDEDTPAQIFMGVSDALKAHGARYIRVR
jgi:hypothetical protein